MNGLMIAFAFTLPYHVLRTATAAGVRVHVLGNGASRGLRMSRYCRTYHETPFCGDMEALLGEIDELEKPYLAIAQPGGNAQPSGRSNAGARNAPRYKAGDEVTYKGQRMKVSKVRPDGKLELKAVGAGAP